MAELVVAPSSCIGRGIFSKAHEMAQHIVMSMSVQQTLSFFVNFLLRTSSIESFVGRTQNGAAIVTQNIIPKRHIKIATGVSVLSVL